MRGGTPGIPAVGPTGSGNAVLVSGCGYVI